MNLVRCDKGHFYDKDTNPKGCPYCVQMEVKKDAAHKEPSPAQELPKPAQGSSINPPPVPSSRTGADPAVRPAYSPISKDGAVSKSQAQEPASPAAAPPDEDYEENCTVGYYSRVIGVEPVVGWLVCIDGEYKGESFKLKSGRNFIGRAANMDIVLSADHSVSRFKHAAVIYEPRSRQFIVATGESRELCYLNDEVVLSAVKMKIYDVLNLGNTSLMLIPCCGKYFSWEKGLELEKQT